MTFQDSIQYLDSFINYERGIDSGKKPDFHLERIALLLELLGRPDKKVNFIHVAGSKGKGSTCAFIAHILKCSGMRTGLYTSPHIMDVRERVRILSGDNSKNRSSSDVFLDCISGPEFSSLIEMLKPHVDELGKQGPSFGKLTYFEILTVLAICHFSRNNVHYAVMETGLGGRLDATNVVEAPVCGITSIGLEHTEQLGKTITAITGEKAAIIKSKGQIAVVAPQEKEALKVINERCNIIGAKAVYLGKDVCWDFLSQSTEGQTFSVRGLKGGYLLKTSLLGACQMINASTAVAIAESLAACGFVIKKESVEQGVAETRWPGRFEIAGRSPFVVLDSAHTPASAENLTDTVSKIFPGKKAVLVLGISSDKDIDGICRGLSPVVSQVILTQAGNPRAALLDPKKMRKFFKGREITQTESVPKAINEAKARCPKHGIIVVTGSIFVMAQAREKLI